PEVRQHIARYYDNLAAQDLAWAECLDALDRSGQADNTVVVYLSDHGRGLPREKRWCYDAGIHLPLIVRGPGIDRGVSDRLVSWVDIAPTVLRLAGVDMPTHYQGQDFLTGPLRQYHFAGRDRMDEAYDCQRAVRSDRWHYVRNAFPDISGARRNMYMETSDAVQAIRNTWADGKLSGSANVWFEPRGHEQLFDVHADPYCVNDVADTHPDIVTELAGALDAHLAEVGDWGAVSEKVMVEAGDVVDRIEENTQRLAPLPTHQQPEPPATSILIPTDRPDAATVIPPARQALDAARAHANR
ncbi:MAG: sulfatase-like hydrolase/transferase, partial [Planctomycetota bacterium]